jgi:hypothetical protein
MRHSERSFAMISSVFCGQTYEESMFYLECLTIGLWRVYYVCHESFVMFFCMTDNN